VVADIQTTPGVSPADADTLKKLVGERFGSEQELRRVLGAMLGAPPSALLFDELLRRALVDDCGKSNLIPRAVSVELSPGTTLPIERTTAGSLATWTASAPGKDLVIDPERGRLLFLGTLPTGPVTISYCVGFSGDIGAGTYDRRASLAPVNTTRAGGGTLSGGALVADKVNQIEDSRTYGPVANKLAVKAMTVQAADQHRPFVRLSKTWKLTGATAASALTLEGLWVGGGQPIQLGGSYGSVTIQHCTLDPGGVDADGATIGPVTLVVDGDIDDLLIEASITGPISVLPNGAVKRLRIRDSVVQSIDPGAAAITMESGEVQADGVTVLGAIQLERLQASEMLVAGHAEVADTQHGCFRFGAALEGSRLPHAYESVGLTGLSSLFTSRRFGDPGFAQLSEAAPAAVRQGGEFGTEMGAFHFLNSPIKLAGLAAKVDEFMPFGLIPLFVPDT
jgi:hypothetical protein